MTATHPTMSAVGESFDTARAEDGQMVLHAVVQP